VLFNANDWKRAMAPDQIEAMRADSRHSAGIASQTKKKRLSCPSRER